MTPPVVSARNDVWKTSAEILPWWRVTYPDVGSPFDRPCVCRVGNLLQPISSTTQIWVVTRHQQYGISALVSQTSFRGETSVGVTKCRLFSQALKKGRGSISFSSNTLSLFPSTPDTQAFWALSPSPLSTIFVLRFYSHQKIRLVLKLHAYFLN